MLGGGLALLLLLRQRLLLWIGRGADRFFPTLREKIVGQSRAALSSLDVLRERGALRGVIGWSAVSWGTALLNHVLLLRALDIQVPPIASLFLLIVLYVGVSLPSLPASIALFEYLCVLALGVFGVGESAALSFGILLHGLILLPSLVGLVLFWGSGLALSQVAALPARDTQQEDDPIHAPRMEL